MKTEYEGRNESKELTLENLFNSKKAYSFLVGSGVSIESPSNLPTGYKYLESLLQHLIPEEKRFDILELMNPDRKKMRDRGDFIRFESLLQILQEWFDPDLDMLDVFKDCTTPNFNHIFLAKMLMLNKEHSVFTTNFDSLIEYALLNQGILKEKIYPVIYKEEWERSEEDINSFPVFKLHGSVSDVRTGKNTKDSLQTTLSQISKGKDEIFSLESWKLKIFQQHLQKKDLVVIGYSGLDDFDIIPSLRKVKSSCSIIWITHTENLAHENALIEQPMERKKFVKIRRKTYLDRVDHNLLSFISPWKSREEAKVIRIRVDTGNFLVWLWDKIIQEKLPLLTPLENMEIPKITIPQSLNISQSMRWFLTGRLFYDHRRLSDAEQSFQKSKSLAKKSGDHIIYYSCLNDIGLLLQDQNKPEKALEYYKEAIKIAVMFNVIKGIAKTLNNMGYILTKLGRQEEVLEDYQTALTIVEKHGDKRVKADVINSKGLLLQSQGNLDKALQCYREALAIDKELGNIASMASRLSNIGDIYNTKKATSHGNLDKALQCYREALAIDKELGNIAGKPALLSKIGNVLFNQGNPNEALQCYQKVLVLDEQLGNNKNKPIILFSIGNIYFNQGDFKNALKKYNRALTLAQSFGDESLISMIQQMIRSMKGKKT